MSLDESKAKALIRAILNEASGAVGTFVPLAEVLSVVGVGATEVLHELAQRRWIRVRNDEVAATKWALEFGMDWTNVPVLLRAILNSAGGIGRPAETQLVVAASGLDELEVDKLLSELGILGLTMPCGIKYESGRCVPAACISGTGWEYLTTSKFKPRLDSADQLQQSLSVKRDDVGRA